VALGPLVGQLLIELLLFFSEVGLEDIAEFQLPVDISKALVSLEPAADDGFQLTGVKTLSMVFLFSFLLFDLRFVLD
jgi:hypothetical protein